MGILAGLLVFLGVLFAVAGLGDPALQPVALPGLIGCIILACFVAFVEMARS